MNLRNWVQRRRKKRKLHRNAANSTPDITFMLNAECFGNYFLVSLYVWSNVAANGRRKRKRIWCILSEKLIMETVTMTTTTPTMTTKNTYVIYVCALNAISLLHSNWFEHRRDRLIAITFFSSPRTSFRLQGQFLVWKWAIHWPKGPSKSIKQQYYKSELDWKSH